MNLEGEHSVMSALQGAALAGARTFTATSNRPVAVDEVQRRLGVAERLEAIGVAADGRTATVAASSGLPAMPEGKLDGPTAARLVADRMGTIADRVRGRVRRLDSGDALSQDVLIELGRELEKQLWMLREQIS